MSTRRDSTTDKRQKSQCNLAFPKESRGAAPTAFEGGTESELAKRTAESPATEQWMEEVCERENWRYGTSNSRVALRSQSATAELYRFRRR
jgi:hypothetical protein